MFDISFSELMVIAVVALIVIGPEKLPKVARTAGAFFGRMQRFVAQVKDEVNRESRFAELQHLQQEVQSSLQQGMQDIEHSILPPASNMPVTIEGEAVMDAEAIAPVKKPRKPRAKKVTVETMSPEPDSVATEVAPKPVRKRSSKDKVVEAETETTATVEAPAKAKPARKPRVKKPAATASDDSTS